MSVDHEVSRDASFGKLFGNETMKRAPDLIAPTEILESKEWEVHVSSKFKAVRSLVRSSWHRRRMVVDVQKVIFNHKLCKTTNKKKEKGRKSTGTEEYHEEIYIRVFKMQRGRAKKKDDMSSLNHNSESTIDDDDDDDDDQIDHEDEFSEESSTTSNEQMKNYFPFVKGWKECYKIKVDRMRIKKLNRNICAINYVHTKEDGNTRLRTRELKFTYISEANDFARYIEKCQQRDTMAKEKIFNRAVQNLKSDSELSARRKNELKLSPKRRNERFSLLVEIVSAKDLPKKDLFSSDPVVTAVFCDRVLHKTKHLNKSLNPIWTIQTRSFFTFDTSIGELLENPFGLTLLIKDYDTLTDNDLIGIAWIPGYDLYVGNGERLEYYVQTTASEVKKSIMIGKELHTAKPKRSSNFFLKYRTKDDVPKISIRCRRATQYDKDFLFKCYNNIKDKEDNFSQSITSIATTKKLKHINMKKVLRSKRLMPDKIYHYRVAPRPHPDRIDETEWMSNKQLEREMMQPSETWVYLKNSTKNHNDFGKLYVEVLKCRNLPNLDMGSTLGNKSDPFAVLVYNDNYVQTEVIENNLNPIWLPWTQRAFVFPMTHPSTQLNLGLFDYDFHRHDFIGRVSIDITPFSPNTEYLLEYDLYKSARIGKREHTYGQLTIRLRIDIENPSDMARSYFSLPPQSYVNVPKENDFLCIRKAVYGKYNRENFSYETISNYIEELKLVYSHSLIYVKEAAYHVLLWRSTMRIKIKLPFLHSERERTQDSVDREKPSNNGIKVDNQFSWLRCMKTHTISIPLYSILTFLTAISAVNQPSLIPSYFFLWIALLFLGSMQFRNSNPDPWTHCKGFGEIFQLYLFRNAKSGDEIKKDEFKAEALKFNQFWQNKIEMSEIASEERYKMMVRAQEKYQISEANITSKISDRNPLKRTLWPLQMWLGWVVDGVRLGKNIVTWEESYISFFITLISLVLSIVLYLVPWASILYWLICISVWTFLGPWMILVDKFYFRKILKQPTKEEVITYEREKAGKYWEATEVTARQAQARREHLVKMSAMKKYLFGKFMLQVPVLKLDRFSDTPLSSSIATSLNEKKMSSMGLAVKESRSRQITIRSQSIVDTMIPKLVDSTVLDIRVGEEKENRSPVRDIESKVKVGSDTTKQAIASICFVIVVASFLTYYAVPIIISF